MKRARRQSIEHKHQVAFMQRVEWGLPEATRSRIWANPNGGMRDKRTAALLKAEGVKRGVPDITVAIAASGHPGMYLEMKRPGGRVSPEQREMHANLRAGGYHVVVAYTVDEAWAYLIDYLVDL